MSQVAALPNPPTLLFVARSNKQLRSENHEGIPWKDWEKRLAACKESDASSAKAQAGSVDFALGHLAASFTNGDLASEENKLVIVDNTSSQEIANSYPIYLGFGFGVVTPNKKAFSGSLQLWDEIMNTSKETGGMVYHESSVGAGLPIISTLKDLVQTGDRIDKIEGVFSGTMSYLFNTFAPVGGGGGKWSDAVKKAKSLGYTEPDPRDDLNGLDVARKLTILARIVGLKIEGPTSFPVESLIPKELEKVKSAGKYLENLHMYDGEMEKVKEDAEAQGKVVRYVGSIDVPNQSLKVGLELLDMSHPIAGLKGSDNIMSFSTKRYSESPLVIQGAG